MFVWCSNYRNRRWFRNRIAREDNKAEKFIEGKESAIVDHLGAIKFFGSPLTLCTFRNDRIRDLHIFSVSRNEQKRQFCGVAKDNKWISIRWDFEVFRFYRLDDISDKVFQRFYSCRSVFGQCLTCFGGSSLPSLFHNYFNHRTLETVAEWRWKPTELHIMMQRPGKRALIKIFH